MSTADLENEARTALSAWASLLHENTTLTPMPRATNPLWRVHSAGPDLVLKQLPQYPPGVPPVTEFRVLTHLQQHGVAVALPIVTDQGHVHASVNERQWTLVPHLPQQFGNFELGPGAAATAHAVGVAIGGLDKALADYPWPVDSYVDDPIEVMTTALPELPPEVVDLVEPLEGLLRDGCANLPTQLTHGDCNDGNVLIDRGRVTGVIDIDHLPSSPRSRDLAYYLASRLSRHLAKSQTAENATAAMVGIFSDYVAGYHQAYPLTEQELRSIVPLMLVTEIGGAHWALNGWETNIAGYQRSLHSISWIAGHFDTLTQAARTAEHRDDPKSSTARQLPAPHSE